jgi:Ser/Thr protein kinase RdoA (MazF antagonist)
VTDESDPTDNGPDTAGGVLHGGGTNVVERSGDSVRRPAHEWSEPVGHLLTHVRAVGFTGAPRYRGTDAAGRDVFDYIAGDVGNYPLSGQVRSDQALVSAARLLRAYHDATEGFDLLMARPWQFPSLEPVEVLCHGDFAPYNCVFRGEEAVAIIDFDTARPGPRWWDLSYALYRFAPVADPRNDDAFGTPDEQARRVRLFLDAYGADLTERARAVDGMPRRLEALVEFMSSAAAAGDENYARHIESGHRDLYVRDIAYMRSERERWCAAVTDGT